MGYFIIKRIFDIILSLFGLFIFSPLILLIAILVFLGEGRPIFYLKRSIGKDGKVFKAIKFRSMNVSSSDITKCGKLLRQTAMDELPQLINILKGEMSFVGPRAYSIWGYGLSKDLKVKKVDAKMLEAEVFKRLSVTPGLTGLAQLSAAQRKGRLLEWDLKYIKDKNIWLDLYIILVSIWIALKRGWDRKTQKL